jgi:hypothetical protein
MMKTIWTVLLLLAAPMAAFAQKTMTAGDV